MRIAYELGIACAEEFQRLRVSRNQRRAGAWCWCTSRRDDTILRNNIGSQWPMGKLVDADHLSTDIAYGDTSIIPERAE